MAEYAGLEIRIGGNTTKLTNALKAPTKSAAELQRRIRQITNAMKFDPTNLKNVDTRIKLTGDRMQSLQSKAQLAKTAMQQLGDSMVTIGGKEKSVRQLTEETDNLSLAAKQADERFNGLTDTLATIYEAWNKSARSEGVDILKNAGIDENTAKELMGASTSLTTLRTELRQYQETARSQKADLSYTGKIIDISDEDLEKVSKLKSLNFHGMFDQGLGLDEAIEQAGKLGVVIEDSAVANVRELQKTFKEAQQDKKAFDDALKFEQLGTDMQRLDSEAESLSQTMRKLDDGMTTTTTSDRFQEAEAHIRSIDAALDNVNADLERTGAALKVDPGNVQLASRYFNDLQQKAALSDEKVQLLNQQMSMLDENGASEAAKDHQDLARWVEESAESARKAQKELSDQQATVMNLDDQVQKLQQHLATIKGDSTLASYSDNVLKWQKNTEKLNAEMEKLAKAQQDNATQQKGLSDAQESFDKAKKSAEEYEAQLEQLEQEYKQLNESYAKIYDDQSVDYDSRLGMYNRLQELPAEIDKVKTAANGAKQEVKEFNRELELQKERATIAKSSLEQAEESVNELKGSVDKLAQTKEVKLFQNPGDEIERTEAELESLKGEAKSATARMNELEAAYDSAKAENELAKTANAMQGVSQEANDTAATLKKVQDELSGSKGGIFNQSTIKSVGMTLSATVTPAVTALGYKMVDASSTIDAAYRDMRKTVEGTEEQFEHLRQSAIEFSRTHVTSADQILQIEAIGGELGVATEDLETFAEVISNIDVATNLDVEGAADALGHLANIMHLSKEDYVGFSDALVRLGNNGASTETEIANIAERIGSMGSIVGMSGSDVLAWASSLASTGQNAEAAATALSKTWSFMETAVAAAGGTIDTSFEAISEAVKEGGDKLTVFANLSGKTVDEFVAEWESAPEDMAATMHDQLDEAKNSLQMIADVAHMSASEFAQAWESDPTKAAEAFIRGLNDIEASGGSADSVLQSLGITAVRQKQGIEGLMQTIGGLDKNLQMSENAWNGVSDKWGQAGDAANEAAKKAEGFSGQIQILKNMWQNMLSELGEGAVPWIKTFSGWIETATSAFSSLSSETKKWIVLAGGIAAAAGPALSMTASFGNAFGEMSKWFRESTSYLNIIKLAYKNNMLDAIGWSNGTISAIDKVKVVGADLGLTLLKGLAVAAVVAGIALIVGELSKLYQQYKDHVAATEGLSNALSGIGDVSAMASADVDLVGTSLRNLASDSREYESRLADLTRTIEDSNKQYGTYAGQMDYYASTIEELGGKADRSEEETHKLEAAIMAVNEACDTTYGLDSYGNIIDTQTGKIQENNDVIAANIDLRKQQALVDYYSDDLAKAVGEQAEAQDKLNEAQQKYNDLMDNREDYFARAKDVYGSNYDEAKTQAAYNKELEDAQTAVRNYQIEVNKSGDAISALDEKIAVASEDIKKSNQVLKDAAAAQAELDQRSETVAADVTGNMNKLSEAAERVGADDAGFNSIVAGLEAISVSAKEMGDVDMTKLATAFSDTGSSMADVVSTLEDGGVIMSTWNAALEAAPGAAENMSAVTAAAFQSMYDSAGQNLNDTMTLIAGLDAVQVGDKTFYIGDNGSITDEQGKVYSIRDDIAAIPDEVITTYYGDNKDALKKAQEAKTKLAETGKQKVKPTINVKDNATKPAETLRDKLRSLNSATAKPTVNLSDNATGKISDIRRDLDNINGKTVTTYVKTVKTGGKQATGGLNSVPVIPEHATGYIATGPTLTNQGWIGEDGIEAVANWATGGAVVPLTNRRYMLPIADAIADGMTRRIGDVTNAGPRVSVVVNGVSGPDEVADAIARRLTMLNL